MKLKNNTLVTSNDLWTLLLCSLRYSMGRRSYMPSLVCDLARKHVDVLDDHNLLQVEKEVVEQLAAAEGNNMTVGDPCDHVAWWEFVHWVRQELRRRGERAAG